MAKTTINIPSQRLTVIKKTGPKNVSISSGIAGNYIIDVAETGKIPIGIVGFETSGGSYLSWSDWIITGTTAGVYYRNQTSSTVTLNSASVNVLYTY